MQSWWALSALRCKHCTRIPRHPSTIMHDNPTYTVNWFRHENHLTCDCPTEVEGQFDGSMVCVCACVCVHVCVENHKKQHLTVRQDLCDTAKRTGDIRCFQDYHENHSWNLIPESDYSKYMLSLWSKYVVVLTVTEMKCYSREIHRHLV